MTKIIKFKRMLDAKNRMRAKRAMITWELQRAFQVYHSYGKDGTDLGLTKRDFIKCRRGEGASVQKNAAEDLIKNLRRMPAEEIEAELGFPLDKLIIEHYSRKNRHCYFNKNEKTKKLIELFRAGLNTRGISNRLQVAENIRKEAHESYDCQTVKNSLDPNKSVIHEEFFNYMWKKVNELYTKKEILSYCGAKNMEEFIEQTRVPVTAKMAKEVRGYMREHDMSINDYALEAGVDSKTIVNVLHKRIGTTTKRVIEPIGYVEDLEERIDKIAERAQDAPNKNFSDIICSIQKGEKLPDSCYDLFFASQLNALEKNDKSLSEHKKLICLLSKADYSNKKEILSIYVRLIEGGLGKLKRRYSSCERLYNGIMKYCKECRLI